MTSHHKVGGIWKTTTPYIKSGGVWKLPKSAWYKIDSEWKSWFLQGGINDGGFTTFDAYNGFGATVSAIALQSDGKLVLGGLFTTFNSAPTNRIIRLNTDGTQDTTFTTNTGTGANSTVNAIVIQPDGKIILAGQFTTFNGVTVNRIVRLNTDGTRDTAFTTNTGTGANGTVNSVAIQSDGKIILVGNFTDFNGVTINGIVRLNSNGTEDTAFTTNIGTAAPQAATNAVAIQSDGKIILGGAFTTFNSVTVSRIARLNSDGTLDTTFTTNTGTGANSTVNAIVIQPDGKIILGGAFTTFRGSTVSRIARLNSDGTLDTAFRTNAGTAVGNTVNSVAIQSDGKIILVGPFLTFNGATVNGVVRLTSNGSIETSFSGNTGTGVGPGNIAVNAIAIKPDGKIILGGAFTTFNGVTASRIVSLNSDGTRDTSVFIVLGLTGTVNAVAIQSDGKIILGGSFTTFNGVTVNRIVRLNTDGTRDTAFTTNTGTGANNTVLAVATQSDGKIILAGQFTAFNGATATRIVRLNSDGTLDTAFITNTGTGANGTVNSVAIQSDGKIILGGTISYTNGSITSSFSTFNNASANRIVRLNSDGTRDAAFSTNIGTGANGIAGAIFTSFTYSVNAIAIQSDGKIILGGSFTTFNGVTVNRIVRLNSDGTRDTGFGTPGGANSTVNAVAILPDGKIILGGAFTTFNSLTVNRIVRLNSDGTRDTGFGTPGGASDIVSAVALQPDGKLILGGSFTTFNGATTTRIVRLNSDGTLDTAFSTNTVTGANNTVNAIAIQSDGKLVLGGTFTGFSSTTRSQLARIGGDIAQ